MTFTMPEPAAWIGEKQAHGWPTFHSTDYVRDYISDTSKMKPLYTAEALRDVRKLGYFTPAAASSWFLFALP